MPSTGNSHKILSKTMRAAIAQSYKSRLEIVNVPMPHPKSRELLVKIKRCGCCHTDLHAIDGDWPVKCKMPLCPGHEGAGIVEAVGGDVSHFKVGDRVGIPWLYSACGTCEYCNSGWETLCLKQQNAGYSVPGGMAEYAIAAESNAILLPPTISFDQVAPILCAGVTAYKAIKETEARPGQFIALLGAGGGLGHLGIQYAKAMGLRVIALDVGADKQKYCQSLGAELAVDVSKKTHVEEIQEYTKGGVHASVTFATNNSAFSDAVSIARRKGFVVFAGLPPGGFNLSIFEVVLKRLTIRGSIVGTKQDAYEALDFAERGLVKSSVVVEDFAKVNDVFDRMRAGKIEGRVVLKISD